MMNLMSELLLTSECVLLCIFSPKGKKKKSAPSSTSNLSMNQTLEGHSGSLLCTTWNSIHRKLTSSDEEGLIIVWMLHKGLWYEEMINNRNKSLVRDMRWSSDGSRICIVYEDGAVIVGSVDGNRLWGKELDINLSLVEWSPDSKNLLFGTTENEVHVYDSLGTYLSKVQIYANTGNNHKLIGLYWYNGINGYLTPNSPCLLLVWENGRVQIGKDEYDDNPVLIDTGIIITSASWNHNGSIVAIAGSKVQPTNNNNNNNTYNNNNNSSIISTEKDTSIVQFYTPQGKHLRTLKVPGNTGITSITWENNSLRLALAVDSFLYFAAIRSDYHWGYFAHTLVYSFHKVDRVEDCVVFWDTNTDERHIKYVKNLLLIRSNGDYCVFATKTDDGSNQFILILCNAIGSPIDSKYIDIEPIYITMTPFHVIVSNGSVVYIWQYSAAISKVTSITMTSNMSSSNKHLQIRRENKEKNFHIDDPMSGLLSNTTDGSSQTSLLNIPNSNDPICAITASKTTLLLARTSGSMFRISLPSLTIESSHVLPCRAHSLALNCDSKKVSIIDMNGILLMMELDPLSGSPSHSTNGILEFERKDVWDMIWSEDNAELFACMEKSRMYVFRGLFAEEPLQSTAYLCKFSNLCITAVNLDDILLDPEHPDKESLIQVETKSLRDTRELLISTPINESLSFIETHSHIRLWRLLAESALEQFNYNIADKAFVKCEDYQGIQFVKRIKLLMDKNKAKAEISAYFRRFDESESVYLSLDCKDSAVDLRIRLGDWFRVVQLIQQMGAGDDTLLIYAYSQIGDYYFDRQKYLKAYKFYLKANNVVKMIDCAYLLDDYVTLTSLLDQLPPTSDNFLSLAEKFQSVGLCKEAVNSYLRAEKHELAINCCIQLNQWDLGLSLATEYKVNGIENLLNGYAAHLLQHEKYGQAIDLYRRACKYNESARLLCDLAVKEMKSKKGKEIRIKKLFVMAALEMTKLKEINKEKISQVNQQNLNYNDNSHSTSSSKSSPSSVLESSTAALESLLDVHPSGVDLHTSSSHPVVSSSLVHPLLCHNIWRPALSYHYLLLTYRYLYSSLYTNALHSALMLQHYEDLIDKRIINSLIALSAWSSGWLGIASKAITSLQRLENTLINNNNSDNKNKEILTNNIYTGVNFDSLFSPSFHLSSDTNNSTTNINLVGKTIDNKSTDKTSTGTFSSGTTGSSMGNDDDIDDENRGKYRRSQLNELAISMFSSKRPIDPVTEQKLECYKCQNICLNSCDNTCDICNKEYGVCIVSGKSLIGRINNELIECSVCKQKAIEREWRKCSFCPLCHTQMV